MFNRTPQSNNLVNTDDLVNIRDKASFLKLVNPKEDDWLRFWVVGGPRFTREVTESIETFCEPVLGTYGSLGFEIFNTSELGSVGITYKKVITSVLTLDPVYDKIDFILIDASDWLADDFKDVLEKMSRCAEVRTGEVVLCT